MVAKKGVMVPGVPYVNRGNWGRECDENVLSYSRSSWTTYFIECCILRGPLGKDSCLIRSSHTQNDVERFWNEPVHELYSLKASRMCKVRSSSHEITNKPYVSSNCENTGRTGFTTNYDAETNTSLIENSRMFVNTTSKVAPTTANWMRILTEATCIVRLNI